MALPLPSVPVPTPDHSRDSASLLPSDSDWGYKKQMNRLGEVSQQLALGCSRMQEHSKVMRQIISVLFGKLVSVESTVALDDRVVLLRTLTIIWNNLLGSNDIFRKSLEDELASCRRSVLAAHNTLATTNPALAVRVPQLVQLTKALQAGRPLQLLPVAAFKDPQLARTTKDLHAGRPIQPLPVTAPFLPPAVAAGSGVAGAPLSTQRGATKILGSPSVKAVSQPTIKAASQPTVKAAGQPTTKAAGPPTVKAAGPPTVMAAGQPIVKAAGQTTAKAKCGPSSHSRTLAAGGCAPGGEHVKRTPAPAFAPSHKRKAMHGSHVNLESVAKTLQDSAELKARMDRFEQALGRVTEEWRNLRPRY